MRNGYGKGDSMYNDGVEGRVGRSSHDGLIVGLEDFSGLAR